MGHSSVSYYYWKKLALPDISYYLLQGKVSHSLPDISYYLLQGKVSHSLPDISYYLLQGKVSHSHLYIQKRVTVRKM